LSFGCLVFCLLDPHSFASTKPDSCFVPNLLGLEKGG
jgi:hypothetical protein